MTNWLGVVSAAHVARGVELGIAQIGHGKRAGLARMSPGDWLVYYSPRVELGGSEMCQSFTAVGTVTDGEIWQGDEGCFQPFRRRIGYLAGTSPLHIDTVRCDLELTAGPNWGYELRRGLIPLSDHDLTVIRAGMLASVAA